MKLVIISGRSGSGKSTALHVLEDIGFYCIDNLPAGLLPSLIEEMGQDNNESHKKVAVSIDARNLPNNLKSFPQIASKLDDTDVVKYEFRKNGGKLYSKMYEDWGANDEVEIKAVPQDILDADKPDS